MEQRFTAPEAGAPIADRHGSTLTTARAALQVLALLQERPDGARANEVASVIGKSLSTASYLLRALCEEGFAAQDGADGTFRARHRVDAAPSASARELSLAALADELFARTHKRSYIGVLDGGAIEIVEVRGRQGLPRLPGMGDRISDAAHASAMGKVVLSLMRPVAVDRYIARGLRKVAPGSITDPDTIRSQLRQARRDGYATDVEELAPDFCCVAAPVFNHDGGLRAVVGISMSLHAFEESLDVLQRGVREVAGTKLSVPVAPASTTAPVRDAKSASFAPGPTQRTALS
jgi:IclR family acetate operon transcriptional repressor